MGPFDHIQKKGSIAIKPQPAQIRKEVIPTVSPIKKTSNITSRKDLNLEKAKTTPPTFSRLKGRSQDTRKKPSNLLQRLESDSDDNDDGKYTKAETVPRKRQRMDVKGKPDISREMRNEKSFLRDGHGISAMVHAADIATVRNPTKYRPAFPKTIHLNHVDLQYPSACAVEK